MRRDDRPTPDGNTRFDENTGPDPDIVPDRNFGVGSERWAQSRRSIGAALNLQIIVPAVEVRYILDHRGGKPVDWMLVGSNIHAWRNGTETPDAAASNHT